MTARRAARGAAATWAGACLGVALLVAAPIASAQVRATDPPGGALLPESVAPHPTRAVALDPAHAARLAAALRQRDQGLLAAARDTIQKLLGEVPHHPLLLTELARTALAQSDWAAVRRLATTERAAQHDSLLLGHELTEALERTGQGGDALRVVVETWAASPLEASWGLQSLLRLAPTDPRAAREALRRAVAARSRPDLARGLALLEWRSGDTSAMVRALHGADHIGTRQMQRWMFADELTRSGVTRDTTGAIEALLDLAGDADVNAGVRASAAERAWLLATASTAPKDLAARLGAALHDLPADQWDPTLRLALARALRETGHTSDARALLAGPDGGAADPSLALERALADLRDGPPERALPALATAAGASDEGAFRYAEALFFAGQVDSAAAWYQRVSGDARGEFTGAALERLYLIEDADPRSAVAGFGAAAYAAWRGDAARASRLADSLVRALPHGALWAQAALLVSRQREAANDARGAIAPLLAIADSLPGDRLAPLARQRAGDLYLGPLKDDARAIEQYEACLERYPRAWNAAEVRRKLEQLRRERRL
ncbi:MAG TPA: hypothetical protein VL332_11030 [Candidatus Saccharimonadaceae bacterium]|jgi:hypothetical protein|nr:hypothetical protein [Candidatus Saccharimonadaceae bacterium]